MKTKVTAEDLYNSWIVKGIPPKKGDVFIDINGKEYIIIKVNKDDFEVEDYNENS